MRAWEAVAEAAEAGPPWEEEVVVVVVEVVAEEQALVVGEAVGEEEERRNSRCFTCQQENLPRRAFVCLTRGRRWCAAVKIAKHLI